MTKDIEREIKEAFHEEAHSRGFCLDQEWSDCENPYLDGDTHLAFDLFKSGWLAAKALEAKKLEGCVVVPVDQAKDTERLDFMLKENMVVSNDINWNENLERTGEGFCVNAVYWIDGWDRLTSTVHQTKREAIDAAMIEAARGGNE